MDQSQYAEYSIHVKPQGWVPLAYISLGFVFLAGVLLMTQSEWAFLIPAAVIVVVAIGSKHTKLEYEYIFVTDEISFDKIYSGSLRKRALTVEMKDVESVEPTNIKLIEQKKQNKDSVFKNFTSHYKGTFNYTMTYYAGGKPVYLFFEPDEHILSLMKKVAPRKVTIAEVRKPIEEK